MEEIKKDYDQLINWYPGHMAKGFREIKEISNLADIFIVVLDARCPISSYNEDFDQIAPNKQRLFIITKSDLMDVNKKEMITKRFYGSDILWLDLRKQSAKKIILSKLKQMSLQRIKKDLSKGIIQTKIKSFVVGIPNCGKSTLINLVSEKSNLKVANFPGVTREKKWVVNKEFLFLDTPGILLPKFTDQEIAIKLLAIGSIKLENFPPEFVATKIYALISKYYPNLLINLDLKPEFEDVLIYNQLYNYAQKYNFYKEKGKIDLIKAYNHFIQWVKNLKGITFD
ncbi:ribosome biogenesis GTPase YlqF [Mycoplasmopsis felis]|uniref:ribosome biogenesis GTPase YlqF n=1 Tax=Mycoplasmopsis felis TaxID=33923 RepID=UPI002AFF201D|nr:ribosome biogenesis GTPase YlqF [Mycoplasmopsis felis]WQQ03722.1 ribosome biogenesis GTPase YlqF [Mycoplasmopsis felis]WQQ05521.1 ribosome biogenesis GTPase YlqF [Mycoplasmopsis felis]WQQ07108.1 ribosome biogenesis GTPase YlqF [Mycoplasmopsis felis]WQQ07734.1 ribosome biogenesis GTPase YlqF [Mycoplasmopsis felis]WQQ08198.1 ribosome biogenesis GTPase YlqF [Mycoplasmopsis felis]